VLLLIVLIVMIVLVLVSAAMSEGDLLSPSVVLTSMFAVSTAFAYLMQDEWVWVSYTAEMGRLLIAGVLAFIAGETFVRYVLFRRRRSRPSVGEPPKPRLLSISGWKIGLISALGAALIAWQYREVSRLAVLGGFSGTGNMLTYYRSQVSFTLSDEALNPLLVQGLRFIEICGYIGAFVFVNNVFVWRRKLRDNLSYLVPIALFVAKNLLNSDRGRILWLLSFMVVAAFYLAWQARGWRPPQAFRTISRAVVLAVLTMTGFYYLAEVVGRTTQRTHAAFEYLAIYLGGPIGNFAQYIEEPAPANSFFGEETFLNVYRFADTLGLTEFAKLSQLEFRYVSPDARGNIYTFFRTLIQDFGVLGMILLSFAIGAFFSWYVLRFIRDREISPGSDCAILIYAYLFFLIITASVQNRLFLYLSVSGATAIVGLLVTYRILVDSWPKERALNGSHIQSAEGSVPKST